MAIELTTDESAAIAYIRQLPDLYAHLKVDWDPERAHLIIRRAGFPTWIELFPWSVANGLRTWVIQAAPDTYFTPAPAYMPLAPEFANPAGGRGVIAYITQHFHLLRPMWAKRQPKTPLCPEENVLPGAKSSPDLARFALELRRLGLAAEVVLHASNPKSGPQQIKFKDLGLERCSIVINDNGAAEFCNRQGYDCWVHDGLTWPLSSEHLPAEVVVHLLSTAGGDSVLILRARDGDIVQQAWP